MVKLTYKGNNIYLDKYIVIKNVEPKNDLEEFTLNASIIENNNYLNRLYKGYKIVDLDFKEEENLYYIKMYNKKYDIKRVEKFSTFYFESKIVVTL